MHTTEFLVRKDQLASTLLRTCAATPLPDGQVRVGIETFALTSNNITYAAMGEAMQYWQFFPVADTGDVPWGHIPVWGFGTVTESRHPQVAVGERLYGYFPMASSVDLTPEKLSDKAFSDAAPHRAAPACTPSTTSTRIAPPTPSTRPTPKTCRPCCGRCSSRPG